MSGTNLKLVSLAGWTRFAETHAKLGSDLLCPGLHVHDNMSASKKDHSNRPCLAVVLSAFGESRETRRVLGCHTTKPFSQGTAPCRPPMTPSHAPAPGGPCARTRPVPLAVHERQAPHAAGALLHKAQHARRAQPRRREAAAELLVARPPVAPRDRRVHLRAQRGSAGGNEFFLNPKTPCSVAHHGSSRACPAPRISRLVAGAAGRPCMHGWHSAALCTWNRAFRLASVLP